MKKTLLLLTLFLGVIVANSGANAQAPAPIPRLYGSSPFQDSLWSIDTTAFNVIQRMGPTLAGFTISGMNGLAFDPTTYQTFIIMKVSGVTGRVLGTIDLTTGVCTQVGNLGDNFSSITFDDNGQLWGATGNGAAVPEALYLIDKTNAAKTLKYSMGNGADGEVILYNRSDDYIYHWSGNGTIVYEKMAVTDLTYTPVNIPISGATSGETFGAVYVNPNYIIGSNISSSFNRIGTNGTYSAAFGANPDDLRGLVMPPQFTISEDTICAAVDPIFVDAGSLQLFDSIVYNWGDGTSDVLSVNSPAASHTYAAPGTYTIAIELDNGVVRDTAKTFGLVVLNIPVVSISGNHNLCPGASNTLTGSNGGTSQWYMNGVAIPGETTNTYVATVAGAYNMTKTNLNGCSDSATVSFIVVDVPNPTVFLGNDTTVCGSIALDAQNNGGTYAWSIGDTTQLVTINFSGTYTVDVIDTNGCSGADTIQLVINPNPVFTLGSDTTDCSQVVLDPTPGVSGTYLWSDNSAATSLAVNSSGVYTLNVVDGNGCSYADTVDVTIFGTPTVALTSNAGAVICDYNPDIILSGTPAGGTYSGPSVTGNAFDPSIGGGNYDIVYSFTDGNGCTAEDTITLTVETCFGINENSISTLVIYPNPTTGKFSLDIPVNGSMIVVNDVFGKTVYSAENLENGISTIELDNQANGTYFVRLTTSDGQLSVARLVVARK